MSQSYKILLVSSRAPEHFAGLGADMMKSLTQVGHQVDYLTRYDSKDYNVISLAKEHKKTLLQKTKKTFSFLKDVIPVSWKKSILYTVKDNYIRGNGSAIVSPNESEPMFSNAEIVSKIKKQYDFVIVFVWQDMITSVSLEAIFQKLKVPILLYAGDMLPFTGGCYYFGDCRRFTMGCGCCPILGSNNANDLTHTNYLLKKSVYSSVPCVFMGNTYLNEFASQSMLFPESQIALTALVLNEKEFIPQNVNESRRYLKIPRTKNFIIFSRFAGIDYAVKGYSYMVEAVNHFAESISSDQLGNVLLILAGEKDKDFEKSFKVDVLNLGMLSKEDLIKAYSASTIFLSSSIDEAGPSMLNQSMMCGTPVVSFDVGAAKDMTENGVTGYKARFKDVHDLSRGVGMIHSLLETDYEVMRQNCRKKALEMNSYKAFSDRTIATYEALNKKFNSNSLIF